MVLAGIDRPRDDAVPVLKWMEVAPRRKQESLRFCANWTNRERERRYLLSFSRIKYTTIFPSLVSLQETKLTKFRCFEFVWRKGSRFPESGSITGIRWSEQSYGHGNNWIMSSRSRPASGVDKSKWSAVERYLEEDPQVISFLAELQQRHGPSGGGEVGAVLVHAVGTVVCENRGKVWDEGFKETGVKRFFFLLFCRAIITFLPLFTFPEFPLDSRNRFHRWTSRENAITKRSRRIGLDSLRKAEKWILCRWIRGKIEHRYFDSFWVSLKRGYEKGATYSGEKRRWSSRVPWFFRMENRYRLVSVELDLTGIVKLTRFKLLRTRSGIKFQDY